MSGGVDSSVAAHLMAEKGYDCIGCTMRLFDERALGAADAGASDMNDLSGPEMHTADARAVTERLGIPFHVFHFEDLFRENVIDPFIKSYEQARTPNPCVHCNRCLKFAQLFQKMEELGCDVLVTGHYARVERDNTSGRMQLMKALDKSKDQSYVLYSLTQEQLAHVQFPLGEMNKSETRATAGDAGFANAEKQDSQDICFIPDGDYAAFIERTMKKTYPEGDFLDQEGNVLGRHKGIIHYTLGQRRGLGIPAASRLYVVAIDPIANTVTLGQNEDLFRTTLVAKQVNLIAMEKIEGELRANARIRYHHAEQPATITQIDDDTIRVVFDTPQRAITPGQSVVLYDADVVLGGGVIDEVL